ncbi:MAG: type II toxin-antitoxin system PemK/MazF family toxin [Patescibacteria group bacterium]
MKQGEIWLASLLETVGREQSGLRPVVIMADTPANVCVVLPLTSNLKALKFPHTIQLDPSKEVGLDTTSVVLAFQIRAIDKTRFSHKIGLVNKNDLQKIFDLVSRLLLGYEKK